MTHLLPNLAIEVNMYATCSAGVTSDTTQVWTEAGLTPNAREKSHKAGDKKKGESIHFHIS